MEKEIGGAASQYVPAFDQVGTTWNLLGSGGTVASYYVYDAFGKERERSETVGELYRYGGRRYARDVDQFLPMYHFATRNQQPTLGRFAERDVGTLDVRNPYAYAQGNPLAYADPTGLQCERSSTADTALASFGLSLLPIVSILKRLGLPEDETIIPSPTHDWGRAVLEVEERRHRPKEELGKARWGMTEAEKSQERLERLLAKEGDGAKDAKGLWDPDAKNPPWDPLGSRFLLGEAGRHYMNTRAKPRASDKELSRLLVHAQRIDGIMTGYGARPEMSPLVDPAAAAAARQRLTDHAEQRLADMLSRTPVLKNAPGVPQFDPDRVFAIDSRAGQAATEDLPQGSEKSESWWDRWWGPENMWWQHFKGTSPALSPDLEKFRRAYQSNRLPLDTYLDPTILPSGPASYVASEVAARQLKKRAFAAATSRFASTGLRHGAYLQGLRPGYWRAAKGIRTTGQVSAGASAFYGGWRIGNTVQAWWHAYDFVYTED